MPTKIEKEIYFATTNAGKYITLKGDLARHGINLLHVRLELEEPRSDDLNEIAKAKVLFAYKEIGAPCIALDAGFYIHALNGFPGSYVNVALNQIGIDGLLTLVQGKKRSCEFRSSLAYYDGQNTPKFFESAVQGKIAEQPRGKMAPHAWSTLFKIFIPENVEKTLAEMTDDEFASWRGQRREYSSATKLGEWLATLP